MTKLHSVSMTTKTSVVLMGIYELQSIQLSIKAENEDGLEELNVGKTPVLWRSFSEPRTHQE